MGIWHAGMRLVNLITLIETQSGRINIDLCNNIQKWHPWNLMVALV
jgi:hypothetical protein